MTRTGGIMSERPALILGRSGKVVAVLPTCGDMSALLG
jgi:hypothetical protein